MRLSLVVEAGRIGLAVLERNSGMLVAEQVVSPTSRPVTINVELPHEGVQAVILRNTSGVSSRALVREAVLCDRTR